MKRNLDSLLGGLRLIVTLAALVLMLIFCATVAVALATAPNADTVNTIVMLWSAAPFYALALWVSRHIFTPYDKPGQHMAARARALRHAGMLVMMGAAVDVVFAPLGLRLALGSGHGAFLHVLPSAIVLGFAGAALIHAASLANRSASLQEELDQFL